MIKEYTNKVDQNVVLKIMLFQRIPKEEVYSSEKIIITDDLGEALIHQIVTLIKELHSNTTIEDAIVSVGGLIGITSLEFNGECIINLLYQILSEKAFYMFGEIVEALSIVKTPTPSKKKESYYA